MNTRELILDTLLTLEQGEEYSNVLIKAVLDKYDYLEAGQKAFIKRVTEGTLERRTELDYYLDHYADLPVKKMRPLIRCLMRMSVYQILYMDSVPDSAVCDEACKLAGKRGFRNLKGFVNGVLRRIVREKASLPLPDRKEDPKGYLSVKYSMPEWLVEMWSREYGGEITLRMLEALLEVHPVSLRFSTLMPESEREKLCAGMRERGIGLRQSPYLPYVYYAEHTEGLADGEEFLQGACMVQDVSSALAVEAAGIERHDFVMDICAAPGGKSILAAEKAREGSVLARDISEEKLALIEENKARMGARNLRAEVFDGTETDEGLAGKADVVLLDVPCSGLGVIGKKRDIKYRADRGRFAGLEELQRQIVRASAGYVKPGGTLLYSTCTIQRGENEGMVRYIARDLGFEPVSLENVLPEAVLEQKNRFLEDLRRVGKEPDADLTEEERNACIQLLPGYMESDGFFLAKFRRRIEA
ncbi:MAG: 16S rRNA (cytosine(967)-C(5))-methyltransferase RsmB [Lachnospiraceae bacterium]|nr:16S rRNA (cytosine(967)-C(5))-methyltransferase RsmB [Lachnospiraceae bacterium]